MDALPTKTMCGFSLQFNILLIKHDLKNLEKESSSSFLDQCETTVWTVEGKRDLVFNHKEDKDGHGQVVVTQQISDLY